MQRRQTAQSDQYETDDEPEERAPGLSQKELEHCEEFNLEPELYEQNKKWLYPLSEVSHSLKDE